MRVKVQLLVVSTALSAAFFAPAASLQTMPAASLHLHEHGHGITPFRPLAASARQLETCREDIGENAASTAALKMPRRHLAFGAAAALLLPMIAAPHKAQAAELLEQVCVSRYLLRMYFLYFYMRMLLPACPSACLFVCPCLYACL